MTNCTVSKVIFLSFLFLFDISHRILCSWYFDSGLCTAVKALGIANRSEDSIEGCLAILLQFREDLPRALGDGKLRDDIDHMKCRLQSLSDDTICTMQENNDKKMTTLMSLYSYLAHIAHYRRPWLVGSLSLRMVELEIKTGLSPMFPFSLTYFGGTLVNLGCITHGCRLGVYSLGLAYSCINFYSIIP